MFNNIAAQNEVEFVQGRVEIYLYWAIDYILNYRKDERKRPYPTISTYHRDANCVSLHFP